VRPNEADPRVETLLKQAGPRAGLPLERRERAGEAFMAASVLAALTALAFLGRAPVHPRPLTIGLLLLAYLVAKRVRFSIGAGTAVPTEAALVPMVLLTSPAIAVALVIAGSVLDRAPDYLARRKHPDHLLLHFGDAWHAIGPCAVIALAGARAPELGLWPVYVAALAAQFAFDGASGIAREWLASGVSPRLQLRLLIPVFAVDAALAPVGLMIALLAVGHPLVLLAGLPLTAVLGELGAERERRIEHALALSDAYRGTALLMGEMLEANDPYTGGEHSQGVVALALAVGMRLGLDAEEQRNLEFAALLHDVGKVRVPPEILNKPGPLSPSEWEVMKRHPVDGQQMLDRIGGTLADAGVSVRAHHERWDGGGYPDGLAGLRIPRVARIICACDAYSAMTTNRPYRKAMTPAEAIAELRRCSGEQFDPAVVGALATVAGDGPAQAAPAALAS
jgi:HD-GYP domain-containing protein (c-di-GMP phosphodiesterase class II)